MAFVTLVGLAWVRHYIGDRRSHYDLVLRQQLPPGATFAYGPANDPRIIKFREAFNAGIWLNGAARIVQLAATLLLCVVVVLVWRWFNPDRSP